MQLEAVTVGPYRQVPTVTIRTERTVVLYGPNGAGKTTLLRALAGRDALPPTSDCPSAPTFYLRLEDHDRPTLVRLLAQAGVAPVFRAIAEAMRVEPERFDFFNDLLDRETIAAQRAPEVSIPDLGGVADSEREVAFVSALLADVSPQGRALAEPFVWELLLHPRLAVCESRVWLAADPSMWPAATLVRVAGAPELADTWVQKVAQNLCTLDEPCPVVRLGSEASLQPHIAWLDGTDGDVERELERLVPQLHDAYWGVRGGGGGPGLSWTRANTKHASVDPWIEAAAEDDRIRPRQSLAPVLAHLEARIAKLVPYFVEAEGGVKLRLEPIPRWPSGRVRIVLAGQRSRPLAAADLSAGARRWIAIAVRAACHELLRSVPRRVANVKTSKEYVAETRHDDIVAAASRNEPVADLQVREFFPPSDSILIVDEPEAHLDSLGVRDVVDTVDALAPGHLATFVATHAREFLNRSQNLHRVDLETASGRALVRRVGAPLLAALRDMSGSVGLDLADVLSASKAALVVADKPDELLVKNLFRAELDRHRVAVLPLNALDNAVAIAEGDFVFRTGLRLFALLDTARREALEGTSARIAESDALLTLMRRVAGRDEALTLIPFSAPDLVAGLPDAAVQRAFPSGEFKGWNALDTEWRARAGGPRNFKQFALDRMKLAQTNVSRFVTSVLEARTDNELAGSELRATMTALFGRLDARPVVAVPAGRETDRETERRRAEERRAELARRVEEGRAEARRAAAARRAEEEAQRRAESERRAELERRLQAAAAQAAEAVRRAEAEAQRRADAEARAAAEAKRAAEAVRRADEEMQARIAADTRAETEAEGRADAERRAEAEAQSRTDAERRAEAELVRRTEAESRVEAEAARRADAERRAEAETARRTAAETRAVAESERRAEAEKRVEAAVGQRSEAGRRLEAAGKAVAEAQQRVEAETARRAAAEKRVAGESAGRAEAERLLAAEGKARAELERRLAAEAKARVEAEERADAEAKARAEVVRRLAAETKARAEADDRAAAEEKARAELERRLAAEDKARAEAAERAEAEAKARAELEPRLAAALKARADAERRLEAEAKARADAEQRAEEEAERLADLERRAEAEVTRRVDIELGRRAELELRAELKRRGRTERRAEPERRGASDAQRRAEDKQRADAELQRRAEAEVDRRAEEARRAEAEAKRRAEAAEAARRAEAEAKRRAEAEAKRRAEEAEAARRAEAEAKRRAEAEAKRRAEAEAKRRAEVPKPKPAAKEPEPASLWEAVDLFPPADDIPDW